jgi:hypothetical protein
LTWGRERGNREERERETERERERERERAEEGVDEFFFSYLPHSLFSFGRNCFHFSAPLPRSYKQRPISFGTPQSPLVVIEPTLALRSSA